MKVSRTRTVSTASAKKVAKTRASDGPGFARHLEGINEKSQEVSQVGEIAGVAPVGSILAAQEVDEDEGRKSQQQLQEYGGNILDRLEEIQQDILAGAIPKDRLAKLAQTLRMKKTSTDDQSLVSIINEIEIRAAVEIAKFSRKT